MLIRTKAAMMKTPSAIRINRSPAFSDLEMDCFLAATTGFLHEDQSGHKAKEGRNRHEKTQAYLKTRAEGPGVVRIEEARKESAIPPVSVIRDRSANKKAPRLAPEGLNSWLPD